MTTAREILFEALFARIAALPDMPPCIRNENDPRTQDYVPLIGYGDDQASHFLSLLDEGISKRDDEATLGPGGPIYEWDLKLVAAYCVRTTEDDLRVLQRDQGVSALCAAILPDSLPDPDRHRIAGANWMWVEEPELILDVRDANVPLAICRIPVRIWFSAANPAA